MANLKVLLLPLTRLFKPWCEDVIAAVDDRHDLQVLDEDRPLEPQFDKVDVVVDQGGTVSTRPMMDAARDARLWQLLGTGFDHFDLAYIKTRKIPAANCPGLLSAVALAETAMMFILMLAGRYRHREAMFQSGEFYNDIARGVQGAHLVVFGFGAGGQQLARRARAFGMKISAIDVRPIEQEILDEIRPDFMGTPDDVDRLMRECDFISLHLHLNDQTRHIIDERRIALMAKTACLINVSRGALVDEESLYRALGEQRIGGAGLDVFAQEPPDVTRSVYRLPNVVVTPHTSGNTMATSRQRAACIAENIERVAAGDEPLYRIDS